MLPFTIPILSLPVASRHRGILEAPFICQYPHTLNSLCTLSIILQALFSRTLYYLYIKKEETHLHKDYAGGFKMFMLLGLCR